jgi:hypothetical protein
MDYGQPLKKCRTKRKTTKKIMVASKAFMMSVFTSCLCGFNATPSKIVSHFSTIAVMKAE